MGEKPYFSQAQLEECTNGDDKFVKCPECKEDFESSRGVSMHYGYNHEGSLKYLFRCEECGRLKFGHGQRNTFCSKYCEIYDRVGTFKHFDEEYLKEQIVRKDKRAVDVAEEISVDSSLIHKWILKYEIGDEYECPSCSKSFATKQGVSKHHNDAHGESISGTKYTCKNCGELFWDMKCDDNHITPQYCSMGCRKTGSKSIYHELTGHDLDSAWEKEIDEILYHSDIEYKHEEEVFEIGNTTNMPDFMGNGWILEVKSPAGYRDKERLDMVGEYLRNEINDEYIIIGKGVDMPCNRFVEWSERKGIVSILSEYSDN